MTRAAAVDRDELVAYLDDLLDSGLTSDYGPNGLQVEGAPTVRRLVTGVSACEELFEHAASVDAEAVLVHHGVFWRGDPLPLVGFRRRRIASLIRGDINLIAYHLPLDRHPELGNNALAARALGLESLNSLGDHEGAPLGFAGCFPQPVDVAELVRRCEHVFAQSPLVLGHRDRTVRSLGIISGGAQRMFHDAIAAGLDAYLTGEASEWVTNVARETDTVYLAAGHHATERLGIRALGEHVAARFGVEVEFFDVPNPV